MNSLSSYISRLSERYTVLLDMFGLILSAIFVHAIYVLFIDPAAADALVIAAQAGDVPERTFVVIVKDIEQELCTILALWCLWLWAFRYRLFTDEAYLLEADFLDVDGFEVYDAETLSHLDEKLEFHIESLPSASMLPAVKVAISSLQQNDDFKEARDSALEACDLHLELLDSKLSVTKYILWAIPSVGFLGTVRGIGEALGNASEAMSGDITGVASSLGIAFNSTFVALFLSLILMFLSYTLQGREERLVVAFKRYIASDVVAKLSDLAQERYSPQISTDRE